MNEPVTALAEFFNDFIGNVVPGSVLFGLFLLLFEWPVSISEATAVSTAAILLWVVLSYATGHVLSATAATLGSSLTRIGLSVDEATYLDGLESRGLVSEARNALGVAPGSKLSTRDLRNKLMTASKEANRLAVRFMHMALLCNGVAVAITVALFARLYAYWFETSLLRVVPSSVHLTLESALMLSVAWLLLTRGVEFRRRSLAIPFTAGPEQMKRDKVAQP